MFWSFVWSLLVAFFLYKAIWIYSGVGGVLGFTALMFLFLLLDGE